jgi:hypothetical protein
MLLSALPPSHLAWLLTHGVRAYVAMPPSFLFPPAQASASEFAKCCSFYLWRLGFASISKSDAALLFNAARLFAQAHAHERAWCATFHALRVVPPDFGDEPTPSELDDLVAAYGPLETETETDAAAMPRESSMSLPPVVISDGLCGARKGNSEPCTAKGQEWYDGRCSHHQHAEVMDVRAAAASDVRVPVAEQAGTEGVI